MPAYNLILFLHVLGAFGIVVAFAVEWIGTYTLQHACEREELRASLRRFSLLPWIGSVSFLVVLISGFSLMSAAWRGADWAVVAAVSLILIAVIGAAANGPRMASLKQAVDGTDKELLTAQILSLPVLWGSLQVRTWMAVGITLLMTVKPAAEASILTIAVSVVIGLATASATLTFYRNRDVCVIREKAHASEP